MKLLLDSSIWLEFFAGTPRADGLKKYFKPSNEILLTPIIVYEVYKKIRMERGERMAVLLLAQMERISGPVIPIDQSLAVQAADVSLLHKIPMADSMIYSAALSAGAEVITMDSHFRGLPNCRFIGSS